jgi:hypothetical protein
LALGAQTGEIHADQMFKSIERFSGTRRRIGVSRGIANQRKRGMHDCLQERRRTAGKRLVEAR